MKKETQEITPDSKILDVSRSSRKSSKKKVAIVDDEADIRSVLSLIVRKAGHDVVVCASSGNEIVDFLSDGVRGSGVDTVLIDYKMPGLNGVEASKAIVARNPKIRIVLVTSADIRNEAEQAGFEYLAKPFSVRRLLDIIDETIEEN
jgi:DNA-binding NtrC family response regulator